MLFFFFQAEDGIRDLVRSRGLGDVYKRQVLAWSNDRQYWPTYACDWFATGTAKKWEKRPIVSVSYTHLTLPTSDLV